MKKDKGRELLKKCKLKVHKDLLLQEDNKTVVEEDLSRRKFQTHYLQQRKKVCSKFKAQTLSVSGIEESSSSKKSMKVNVKCGKEVKQKPKVGDNWSCLVCNGLHKSLEKLNDHYVSSHSIKELSCTIVMLQSKYFVHSLGSKEIEAKKETARGEIEACDAALENANLTFESGSSDESTHNMTGLNWTGQMNTEVSSAATNVVKKKHKKCDQKIGSRAPHTCPTCGKILSSRGNLKKHEILHKQSKPWSCEECSIGFNSKRDHNHHQMQRHSQVRPFICDICGKGFVYKHYLSEHMNYHSGEKPCTCKHCGKSFASNNSLNKHQQRHAEQKLHACSKCGKTFMVRYDLTAHFRKVHASGKKSKCGVERKPLPIINPASILNIKLNSPQINSSEVAHGVVDGDLFCDSSGLIAACEIIGDGSEQSDLVTLQEVAQNITIITALSQPDVMLEQCLSSSPSYVSS